MPKLKWDQIGERLYEIGVKQGVCYPLSGTNYTNGEAWNGLTTVNESPSGAEPTALWADDIKYLNLMSSEEFGATIECYTYPDAFAECNGERTLAPGVRITQQTRKTFGLCYRTIVGNDVSSNDYGYKLHLVYGCLASPSEKSYNTVNDSPEAGTMSFEIKTTPVSATGFKPTSLLTIDSTDPTINSTKLTQLEEILYGSDGGNVYTEFTGTSFEIGVVYFERSGTEGSYVYTPTTDTTPQGGTTYYTNGAKIARLPLPDEVATIMGTSATPGQG